ncbi:unnamed protein product [Leptidea sinapis]|uniref:Ig-like domain-containing protein n=1 Tax=Leptidea sinapis TaxID=189913 RepID=A0A5E4Q463_9NEOP|nr:unnamed protein product [Leptidea sinapis]
MIKTMMIYSPSNRFPGGTEIGQYSNRVHSVRIVNMRVPEVLQFGTREAITLDCDYITSNVTGLVLKWFYNGRSQPVYQWIPPQKPQALGILKDKFLRKDLT